jgi:hypothetical protein
VASIQELQQIESLARPNLPELRDEYICSWCEIRDNHLLAVPYPNSRCEIRQFSYPREAEIIGRVTGVAMRLAESRA